jgi:hypothetical protein
MRLVFWLIAPTWNSRIQKNEGNTYRERNVFLTSTLMLKKVEVEDLKEEYGNERDKTGHFFLDRAGRLIGRFGILFLCDCKDEDDPYDGKKHTGLRTNQLGLFSQKVIDGCRILATPCQ